MRPISGMFGFLVGSALLPGVTTADAEQWPVATAWQFTTSKSTLNLTYTAFDKLKGHVATAGRKKKWRVEGKISRKGKINLIRHIPVTELTKTPAAALTKLQTLIPVPGRRGFIRGKVELDYNPRTDRLKGYYERILVNHDKKTGQYVSHKAVKENFVLFRKFQGNFAKSRDRLKAQAGKNGIDIVMTFKGRPGCKKLAFVSVFHIRNDKTGKIVIPPKRGQTKHFTPPGGLAPHVSGYVVDAPIWKIGQNQVKNQDPSMPTATITKTMAKASDKPNFVKRGYTAYFETALVCLDAKTQIILRNSLRWLHRSGLTQIVKRGRSVDQKFVSAGFRKALEKWVKSSR